MGSSSVHCCHQGFQVGVINNIFMRFIKAFIVGLVGLFIIITLLSLLLPSNVRVSRAVVMNSTTGKVYTQIADLKNWKNWQPLFASDSAIIVFSPAGSEAVITYKSRQIHITITATDSTAV